MSRTYRNKRTHNKFFGNYHQWSEYQQLVDTNFYVFFTDNIKSFFKSEYAGSFKKILNKAYRNEAKRRLYKCPLSYQEPSKYSRDIF